MRSLPLSWLAVAAALLIPTSAEAQKAPLRVRIEKVRVGFQGTAQEDPAGTFKPGLWAPLHVTMVPAPDGDISLPMGADDSVSGELVVETSDSDGLGTIYRQKFGPLRRQERFELLTYVKTAATGPEIRVAVRSGGHTSGGYRANPFSLQLHEHLYVTLGARLKEMNEALLDLRGDRKENKERNTAPRYVAHETEVSKLPAAWYGYNTADLVVLTTENETFMKDLTAKHNADRVKALAEWVRRGGRLVVSASWDNQARVHKLLGPEYWDPPLPPMVAPAWKPGHQLTSFVNVEHWAKVPQNLPLLRPGDDPLRIAVLERPPAAESLLGEEKGPLLAVRAPYGLGSVTVLAFGVEKGAFAAWGEQKIDEKRVIAAGAAAFWKGLLTKLAPKVVTVRPDEQGMQRGRVGPRGEWIGDDLTTNISAQLETFDSPPIGFGWVALFILLYIVIVGPLDYFILKKVFKRLELTWITFPVIVLTVSLIAYLTAHAIKGNELKVNKIDLIDIDLRTDLDKDLKTRRAYVHGTSWFTILSPRIESYTVGIEPVFAEQVAGDKERPQPLVSWLGRPEVGGMGGIGRTRSAGLLSRAYEYAQNPPAGGLKDVPIPVWTTKAFAANWETTVKTKLPLEANLHYAPGAELFTGTIKSNLPSDLRDVRLIYGEKFYRLDNLTGNGGSIRIDPEQVQRTQQDLQSWNLEGAGQMQLEDFRGGVQYEPWPLVRELLFRDRTEQQASGNRNHAQRPLDQSWRVGVNWRERETVVREAILVGRYARARGSAESLHADNDPRLPTHLWLKDLPGEGRQRPAIPGTMYQDTYVRVILPVTPAPAKKGQ